MPLRFDTRCDGKHGYLCAEWVGGPSDVLEYLLTWMDEMDAAFLDNPEVMAAYVRCFEAKGRPRDEEALGTLQVLEGFSPPGMAEAEMAKAINAVDDEFMRHIQDFIEFARNIVSSGKAPLVMRYSEEDKVLYDR